MEISVGRIYNNKTKKYLLPIIKDYGNDFVTKISSVFKLAIGVGDVAIPKGLNFNNHIFILIDTNKNTKNFANVLAWLQINEIVEFDYPFDDINDGYQHMLVFKIPDIHKEKLLTFVKGKFSKMYHNEELKRYFKSDDLRFKVLTKQPEIVKEFVDNINATYFDNPNEYIRYDEWDGEADTNFIESQEIFNFNLIK